MFNRFARFLALAFTAAAIPTSAAHALPVEPVAVGSVTKGTVIRSDAAQTQASPPVAASVDIRSDAAQTQASPSVHSSDRSDAAQISPADHVVLRGRPLDSPAPAAAPSPVTVAADDGFDWVLAGMAALIALSIGGAAVALRPTRVAI